MNDVDKLRILIPHWIEHNEEHAMEFRHWSGLAGSSAEDILEAVNLLSRANHSLEIALEKLGGALPHSHHEHDL